MEDAVHAVGEGADGDGSLSRRTVLKGAGVVGGAMAVAPWMKLRTPARERPIAVVAALRTDRGSQ
jgi:hypothetical protein